jgi:hypothetical protein
MITVHDIEYYSKTYVKMHGPIDSQEKLVDMLNWVEKMRSIPEDRRKKILRIKNAKRNHKI